MRKGCLMRVVRGQPRDPQGIVRHLAGGRSVKRIVAAALVIERSAGARRFDGVLLLGFGSHGASGNRTRAGSSQSDFSHGAPPSAFRNSQTEHEATTLTLNEDFVKETESTPLSVIYTKDYMNRTLTLLGLGILGALLVTSVAYGAYIYLAPQPVVVTPEVTEPTPETPEAPAETPPQSLPYGTVTARLGQTVVFPGITFSLTDIVEDSRCPTDVTCIQAGTVRVRAVSEGNTTTLELGKKTVFAGHTISLDAVTPSRVSTAQTEAGEYRFTLTVSRELGKCYVGGCSAQLCTDRPDAVSTCEWTEAYACYKTAVCERQTTGQCGWTQSSSLTQCLANAR